MLDAYLWLFDNHYEIFKEYKKYQYSKGYKEENE